MKSDQSAKSSIIVYVLAGVVPATYIVGLEQSDPHVERAALPSLFLLLLSTFIGAAIFGFLLAGRARVLLIAVSAFVGICLGVIANAIYDSGVNNIDHNLFPFE